jgi:hypothetical protein
MKLFASYIYQKISNPNKLLTKLSQEPNVLVLCKLDWCQGPGCETPTCKCVQFRPLIHKERKAVGENICFKKLNQESLVFKVWTLFFL